MERNICEWPDYCLNLRYLKQTTMQKFIVTGDGKLKFGDVTLHKNLLATGETCIGGGVYEFDYVGGRMLLSGKSYDFGRVKWSLVDRLMIPSGLRGLAIFYEDIPLEEFAEIVYDG